MDCPYGHRFSKTRYGTICPHCGFDLDTPEKVYVNLRKECGLSLREERPVCAWLVCIEGARKGKSYVISFGENFVGTDRDNEIQVLGDEKIKEKHTLIYFDEETGEGILLPARADGIVYIDNKAVYERRILKEQKISRRLAFILQILPPVGLLAVALLAQDHEMIVYGKGCYNLGVLYSSGKGVKQDYKKANEAVKKATEKGWI